MRFAHVGVQFPACLHHAKPSPTTAANEVGYRRAPRSAHKSTQERIWRIWGADDRFSVSFEAEQWDHTPVPLASRSGPIGILTGIRKIDTTSGILFQLGDRKRCICVYLDDHRLIVRAGIGAGGPETGWDDGTSYAIFDAQSLPRAQDITLWIGSANDHLPISLLFQEQPAPLLEYRRSLSRQDAVGDGGLNTLPRRPSINHHPESVRIAPVAYDGFHSHSIYLGMDWPYAPSYPLPFNPKYNPA